MFPSDIPEKHLEELKKIMADFLLKKARKEADEIWDNKGYSDEKLKDILDS
jgi:hypothetical protein